MPWTLNKHHFLSSRINLLADVWHGSGKYTQLKNTDEGRAEPNFLTIQTLLNRQHRSQKKHELLFLIYFRDREMELKAEFSFLQWPQNSILKPCSALYLLLFCFGFSLPWPACASQSPQSCRLHHPALTCGEEASTSRAAVGSSHHLSGPWLFSVNRVWLNHILCQGFGLLSRSVWACCLHVPLWEDGISDYSPKY